MSSKQTCICLTYSVYTKCENGCGFVKWSHNHHHDSAVQWS